jgi:hypothetical protein
MYKSKYSKLIQHLINEHDLILLDSEIQEIENFVDKDLEAIDVIQCCESDSEQLPTKQYEIEFSNHLRCGINVTNNEINVIGAIDGWGNGVGKDVITVKEL